jgi:hypothetical protein
VAGRDDLVQGPQVGGLPLGLVRRDRAAAGSSAAPFQRRTASAAGTSAAYASASRSSQRSAANISASETSGASRNPAACRPVDPHRQPITRPRSRTQ